MHREESNRGWEIAPVPFVGRVRSVPQVVQEASARLRKEGTPAERLLWRALRDRQLDGYKFRRQHALGTFVLDFYCPEAKPAVEVDGFVHTERDQALKDAARTEVLNNFGISVLRIPNRVVVVSVDTALQQIRQALRNSPKP